MSFLLSSLGVSHIDTTKRACLFCVHLVGGFSICTFQLCTKEVESVLKMSLFRYITKSNIKAHGPTKRWITATSCLRASKKIFDDSDEQSREAVKNLKEFKDKNLYAEYNQKAKGVIYDKKPFKYNCIAGKAYFWCTCGIGHKQVSFV